MTKPKGPRTIRDVNRTSASDVTGGSREKHYWNVFRQRDGGPAAELFGSFCDNDQERFERIILERDVEPDPGGGAERSVRRRRRCRADRGLSPNFRWTKTVFDGFGRTPTFQERFNSTQATIPLLATLRASTSGSAYGASVLGGWPLGRRTEVSSRKAFKGGDNRGWPRGRISLAP